MYIIANIEISSDSDEENSGEGILVKKIQMMKNNDYEENSDQKILKKLRRTKILIKKILMKKCLVKKILMKKISFFYT